MGIDEPSPSSSKRGRRSSAAAVLRGFDSALARVEFWIIVASFVAMLTTMGGVIVSRYSSLHLGPYSDLGVGLISWVGMLGASLAIRGRRHVGIGFVRDRLSPRGQVILQRFSESLVALFLAFLAWSGGDLVVRQLESGVTTPALEFPRWILSLSVPVGATFALIHQLVAFTESDDPLELSPSVSHVTDSSM